MANNRASSPDIKGSLPTFDMAAARPGNTDYRSATGAGLADDKAASVFAGISDRFFSIAEDQAKIEGREAGTLAALEDGWRPTNDWTARGKAYDAAGMATYQNRLNAKIRDGTEAVYAEWEKLPPGERTVDRLNGGLDKLYNTMLRGVDGDPKTADVFPAVQAHFEDRFSAIRQGYVRYARGEMEKRQADNARASFIQGIQSLQNSQARLSSLPGDSGEALQKNQDDIDATADGAYNAGTITAVQRDKIKNDTRQMALGNQALANFKTLPAAQQAAYIKSFEADWGGARKATRGMDEKTYENTLDQMRSVISTRDRQATRNVNLAKREVNSAQKVLEQGDTLPQQETARIRNTYGNSPDPEVTAQIDRLDTTQAMFQRFKGMRPEAIEAEVASLRAAAAKDGATADQRLMVQSAENYAKRLRTDLKDNMLSRAAREGVVGDNGQFVSLSVADRGMFRGGLVQRAAELKTAEDHYGQRGNFLLPGERDLFRSIAATGGPRMIEVAGDIVQAMGPDAGRVFREIGGDAPDFAHVGKLAMLGADPQGLRDYAERKRLHSDEKATRMLREPNRTPQKATADKMFESEYGEAFATMPQFGEQARAAAVAMWQAQGMSRNYNGDLSGDSGPALKRDAQIAAGASYVDGVQYGGVGDFKNGTVNNWWRPQRVALPPGVRADGFTQVINAIRDDDLKKLPSPPTTIDGKPISAKQIRTGNLVSIGHGQYRVALGDPKGPDPQWVMAPGGKTFVLDIEAMGETLRQRVPGAWRDSAPVARPPTKAEVKADDKPAAAPSPFGTLKNANP
ncbi:MAG TPA: hypothetical protein VGU72_04300 [Beijerinckiaceae bacterium]|jgi:hypothetical protein|nr:hypothetical protein [Beijerinckiaceae bacterium]